jgi:hypothetical protein
MARWVCPTCKAEVARLIGDRWRVQTITVA